MHRCSHYYYTDLTRSSIFSRSLLYTDEGGCIIVLGDMSYVFEFDDCMKTFISKIISASVYTSTPQLVL